MHERKQSLERKSEKSSVSVPEPASLTPYSLLHLRTGGVRGQRGLGAALFFSPDAPYLPLLSFLLLRLPVRRDCRRPLVLLSCLLLLRCSTAALLLSSLPYCGIRSCPNLLWRSSWLCQLDNRSIGTPSTTSVWAAAVPALSLTYLFVLNDFDIVNCLARCLFRHRTTQCVVRRSTIA